MSSSRGVLGISGLCGFACAALLTAGAGHTQEQRYTIIDLGTLGGSGSEAAAISEFGHVTGWSRTNDGSYHAFLWTPTDGMMDLGVLAMNTSYGEGVNSAAQVVGGSASDDGQRAFLWEDGNMIDLGTLGGDFSYAWAINEAGTIAGEANDGSATHAFIRPDGGSMSDIGTLTGNYSRGEDINLYDEIVGVADLDTGRYRAFFWSQQEGMVDLGTLGGSWSKAYGINDDGMIVGEAVNADNRIHAFSCVYPQPMVDLGVMPNGLKSVARAVNNDEIVVGHGQYQGSTRALLWEGGEVYYLGDMVENLGGWILEEAHDINHFGNVVGWGWRNNEARAFLLTQGMRMLAPVPGTVGNVNRFTVQYANPNERIHFAYGFKVGTTNVPQCPGVVVEIKRAKVLGTANANFNGTAHLDKFIPQQAAGLTIRFQALQWSRCEVSNLVLQEF